MLTGVCLFVCLSVCLLVELCTDGIFAKISPEMCLDKKELGSQCYFASIFYSTAYFYRIISFCFISCILFYVACAFVICLIKYLLTYLLTCFGNNKNCILYLRTWVDEVNFAVLYMSWTMGHIHVVLKWRISYSTQLERAFSHNFAFAESDMLSSTALVN